MGPPYRPLCWFPAAPAIAVDSSRLPLESRPRHRGRNDTGGCDEAHTGHLQGHPCDDEYYWRQREASRFALSLQVPYQRLQSAQDHAQPDVEHALLMIANATAQAHGGHGTAPWTRLNDLQENTVYPSTEPPFLPARPSDIDALITQYAQELFDAQRFLSTAFFSGSSCAALKR